MKFIKPQSPTIISDKYVKVFCKSCNKVIHMGVGFTYYLTVKNIIDSLDYLLCIDCRLESSKKMKAWEEKSSQAF